MPSVDVLLASKVEVPVTVKPLMVMDGVPLRPPAVPVVFWFSVGTSETIGLEETALMLREISTFPADGLLVEM